MTTTATAEIDLVPLTSADLDSFRPLVHARLVDQRVRAGWRAVDAEALAPRVLDRGFVGGELAPGQHVWRVVSEAAELGFVWLMEVEGRDSAHVVCLDVELGVAAATFAAVAESARGLGASRVVVSRFDGDEVTEAFLDGQDLELTATKMELKLSDGPDEEDRVRLTPMTAARFDTFVTHEIEHYAREMHDAGTMPDLESARTESRRQHEQLLPDGLATPDQWLWSACDGETEVGVLWINVAGDRAFIYDIEVDEACRRRGYGGAILRAGARASIDQGAKVLGLNVFGPNAGARALYEKSGYATTEQIVTATI